MPRVDPLHGFEPDGPSRQNCANCGRPAQKSYFGRHTCTDRRFKRARTVQSATIGTPFDLRAALVSRWIVDTWYCRCGALVLQMRGLRLKVPLALASKARQPTRHKNLHLLARAVTRLLSQVPQTCKVILWYWLYWTACKAAFEQATLYWILLCFCSLQSGQESPRPSNLEHASAQALSGDASRQAAMLLQGAFTAVQFFLLYYALF